MKKVTDISNLSRITSADRRREQERVSKLPPVEYVAIILDLFEALADLFQNKCKAQGLEIFDSDDEYTRTFIKWCLKLNDAGIKKDDMRRGLKHLEEAVRDAARSDNEMWPPDFASFIGHCQAQKERGKMWKSLPKPELTNEDKKERMKKLRGELNI